MEKLTSNKHGNIKCAGCGSYNMKMQVSYDGADWNSEAGEGSEYGYEICLYCADCGRVYPVCRLNRYSAVSPIKDK